MPSASTTSPAPARSLSTSLAKDRSAIRVSSLSDGELSVERLTGNGQAVKYGGIEFLIQDHVLSLRPSRQLARVLGGVRDNAMQHLAQLARPVIGDDSVGLTVVRKFERPVTHVRQHPSGKDEQRLAGSHLLRRLLHTVAI